MASEINWNSCAFEEVRVGCDRGEFQVPLAVGQISYLIQVRINGANS